MLRASFEGGWPSASTGWACMPCSHQPPGVDCHQWQKLDYVSVLLRCQGGLPMLMLHWASQSSVEACLSMIWGVLPTGYGTDPALANPCCPVAADRLQHRRLVLGWPVALQGALAVAVVHLISDGTADVGAADDHAACRAPLPSEQPGKVRTCWPPATSRICTSLMPQGVSDRPLFCSAVDAVDSSSCAAD